MMPERGETTPDTAEQPSSTDGRAALGHPFVCRLLELGLPFAADARPPAGCRTVSAPARLDTLAAGCRTPLADINPPPLPQAFLALRQAARDPMSTMAEVAAIISMDPGLAAYVLRLANSVLYSFPSRVETVDRAVACIGLAEIQTLAMGATLGKAFKDPPRADVLVMKDFWRHAVSVGLLSSALAERLGAGGRERFFTAGLLHDMGRLLLAIAEPDLAGLALARAAATGGSLDAAEREVLDFDHAVLGGRVCGKWQLPDSLGEAVACHHAPNRCPENDLAAVVHVADFMANALGLRATPAAGLPVLDLSVLAGLGLTEADPSFLLDVLEAGLAPLTALFVV